MRFHDYFYYRLKKLPEWVNDWFRVCLLVPGLLDVMTWGIILKLTGLYELFTGYRHLDIVIKLMLITPTVLCDTEKRFARVKSHYEYEKHKTLKGCGLVLYYIGVVALWIYLY